jgi:hypothetical protein
MNNHNVAPAVPVPAPHHQNIGWVIRLARWLATFWSLIRQWIWPTPPAAVPPSAPGHNDGPVEGIQLDSAPFSQRELRQRAIEHPNAHHIHHIQDPRLVVCEYSRFFAPPSLEYQ